MTDYRHSVREHLAASKKRLEKGDLTDIEAETLRKKIEGLSILLDDKHNTLGK